LGLILFDGYLIVSLFAALEPAKWGILADFLFDGYLMGGGFHRALASLKLPKIDSLTKSRDKKWGQSEKNGVKKMGSE